MESSPNRNKPLLASSVHANTLILWRSYPSIWRDGHVKLLIRFTIIVISKYVAEQLH